MWRTEISVVHFVTELSVRLTTEISVKLTSKADETNYNAACSVSIRVWGLGFEFGLLRIFDLDIMRP